MSIQPAEQGASVPDQVIARLQQVRAELEQAREPQELAHLSRKADALAYLARKAGASNDVQFEASEMALRTHRKLGQALDEDGRIHRGGAPRNQGDTLSHWLDLPDDAARQLSSRAQNIAQLNEADFEDYIAARRLAQKELTKAGAIALAKRLNRRSVDLAGTRAPADDPDWPPPSITLADWRDWLPAQPPCDLLLTDPPYATDVPDIEAFARSWLPVALDKILATGRGYVCIGAYPDELAAYLAVKPPAHLILSQVLVWTYRNTLGPSPRDDYKLNWQAILYYRGLDAPRLDCPEMVEQFSVQDLNAPDGRLGDRYHAWQKPLTLAERFVRHATRPGQFVLDPFAGTGTHLLAAARLGRVAAGCDIDPDTLAIAVDRGCAYAS